MAAPPVTSKAAPLATFENGMVLLSSFKVPSLSFIVKPYTSFITGRSGGICIFCGIDSDISFCCLCICSIKCCTSS
jgi:hypothetical protein